MHVKVLKEKCTTVYNSNPRSVFAKPGPLVKYGTTIIQQPFFTASIKYYLGFSHL